MPDDTERNGERYTESIQVWIPTDEGRIRDKDVVHLEFATVFEWMNRFNTLMSGLFGGATITGVSSFSLCERLIKMGIPRIVALGGLTPTYGSYYVQENNNGDPDPFKKLRGEILTAGSFSEKHLLELNGLEAIQKEPVIIVKSESTLSHFTKENRWLVKLLLLKMGEETKQHSVAWMINGDFQEFKKDTWSSEKSLQQV